MKALLINYSESTTKCEDSWHIQNNRREPPQDIFFTLNMVGHHVDTIIMMKKSLSFNE